MSDCVRFRVVSDCLLQGEFGEIFGIKEISGEELNAEIFGPQRGSGHV